MRKVLALALAVLMIAGCAEARRRGGASGTQVAPGTPPAAAAAGYYTETLATDSFTTGNTDTLGTNVSGFQWYVWKWLGYTQDLAAITLPGDGTVSMLSSQGLNQSQANLASAVKNASTPFFKGTVYGGGFYAEASISFDAPNFLVSTGPPAVWDMSVEHLDGDHNDQWTGEPNGCVHFHENDYIEYNTGNGVQTKYHGGAIDWFDYHAADNCVSLHTYHLNNTDIVRNVPGGTDWTQWHTVGMLWVPATATTNGTISYYFDNVQVGVTTSYSQLTNQGPPPCTNWPTCNLPQPWTFGIADSQHKVLIMGTGTGTALNVRWYHVWQASSAGNITN